MTEPKITEDTIAAAERLLGLAYTSGNGRR